MNLGTYVKQLEKIVIDNSPTILTGIATTGVVTSAILAARGAFKAAEVLKLDEDLHLLLDERHTLKEQFNLTWKCYIPAAGVLVFTVAAIIGANQIGHRRAAGLAAAYTVSERAFSEYREKVVEKMGEKKEKEARDEVVGDRMARNPLSDKTIVVGDGEVMCYDAFTDRYFRSSVEHLRAAQNTINHMINTVSYASLGDFYREVGIPATSGAEEVGWNSDRLMELQISTHMSPEGKPCVSTDFDVKPVRDYYRFH